MFIAGKLDKIVQMLVLGDYVRLYYRQLLVTL